MTVLLRPPDAQSTARASEPISPRQRVLILAMRQALLIMLGALEDYLGLPRTKRPSHSRGDL